MRAVLPEISFPCLSFAWDLIAPSGIEAVDCGPGLIAAPGDEHALWPGAGLGSWKRAWDFVRGEASPEYAKVFEALDTRVDDPAGLELTFAEWFTRWDSGQRPLLVDRVALDREGFGPKSVCTSSRASAEMTERCARNTGTARTQTGDLSERALDHDGNRGAPVRRTDSLGQVDC